MQITMQMRYWRKMSHDWPETIKATKLNYDSVTTHPGLLSTPNVALVTRWQTRLPV